MGSWTRRPRGAALSRAPARPGPPRRRWCSWCAAASARCGPPAHVLLEVCTRGSGFYQPVQHLAVRHQYLHSGIACMLLFASLRHLAMENAAACSSALHRWRVSLEGPSLPLGVAGKREAGRRYIIRAGACRWVLLSAARSSGWAAPTRWQPCNHCSPRRPRQSVANEAAAAGDHALLAAYAAGLVQAGFAGAWRHQCNATAAAGLHRCMHEDACMQRQACRCWLLRRRQRCCWKAGLEALLQSFRTTRI